MKGPRIIRKKAIDTEKDPYLLKLSPEDMAVCRKCGAVYHDKRWSLSKTVAEKAARKKSVDVLCPACQKIKEKFAGGFVTIQGDFVQDHKEELLNLVRNKEKRAMHYNPLNRIIEIKERKGVIEVSTTTDKLAQKLGQMIKKAFNGEIEYKWSSDTKLARVVWTRDAS
jgi:NMD protein affecting ribosome stability and mRNA decay